MISSLHSSTAGALIGRKSHAALRCYFRFVCSWFSRGPQGARNHSLKPAKPELRSNASALVICNSVLFEQLPLGSLIPLRAPVCVQRLCEAAQKSTTPTLTPTQRARQKASMTIPFKTNPLPQKKRTKKDGVLALSACETRASAALRQTHRHQLISTQTWDSASFFFSSLLPICNCIRVAGQNVPR